MAICRHFQKPDLFLTMTANPKWPEILCNLFPGQTATNYPNIISWVCEKKKKALLKLIDNGFFVLSEISQELPMKVDIYHLPIK